MVCGFVVEYADSKCDSECDSDCDRECVDSAYADGECAESEWIGACGSGVLQGICSS